MTPSSDQQEKVDALVEALTMTGCRDQENLIDMANTGKGLLERIDLLTRQQGPFEGWTPADDPCEIVFDLSNALDDAETLLAAEREENERLRTDLKAIGKAAETGVERLRGLSEGVIFPEGNFTVASSEAHHVVHASTTGVGVYPTPTEARMGFKSGDVSVEGSPNSIEEVMRWRFELAYAEDRATSAQAQITAQAEEIRAFGDLQNEHANLLEASRRQDETITAQAETIKTWHAVLEGIAKRDVGPSGRIAQAALAKYLPDTGEQSQ